MTLGFAIEVTAEAFMNQCAETATIARGFGIDAANSDQAFVKRFVSNVFIGLPWPINTAGIFAIRILFLPRIQCTRFTNKNARPLELTRGRAL
jgi:hypothetical protein